MDRREARELLLGYSRFINEETDLWEALDLAIEALQEKLQLSGETSTISEETSTNWGVSEDGKTSWFAEEVTGTRELSLEEWQELDRAIRGDAESATTTDCISRQQAIEAIGKEIERIRENPCAFTEGDFYYQNALKLAQEIIELQPPVTPTERTGEWVSHELWDMPWFTCSECNYHGRSDFKFCPNCGAKMGGDE